MPPAPCPIAFVALFSTIWPTIVFLPTADATYTDQKHRTQGKPHSQPAIFPGDGAAVCVWLRTSEKTPSPVAKPAEKVAIPLSIACSMLACASASDDAALPSSPSATAAANTNEQPV